MTYDFSNSGTNLTAAVPKFSNLSELSGYYQGQGWSKPTAPGGVDPNWSATGPKTNGDMYNHLAAIGWMPPAAWSKPATSSPTTTTTQSTAPTSPPSPTAPATPATQTADPNATLPAGQIQVQPNTLGIIAGAQTSGATYNPAQAGNPTQWSVSPEQTMQGQLKALTDQNNPMTQQWMEQGREEAAARGFTGNSSIRDSGIIDSVMRNAIPIAQGDANTYAKAAGYNADTANQFTTANTNAQNTAAQFNANSQNQNYATDLNAIAQQQNDLLQSAQMNNADLLSNNTAAQQAFNTYQQAVATINQSTTMDAAAKQAAIKTQTQIFNQGIAGIRAQSPKTPNVSSLLQF